MTTPKKQGRVRPREARVRRPPNTGGSEDPPGEAEAEAVPAGQAATRTPRWPAAIRHTGLPGRWGRKAGSGCRPACGKRSVGFSGGERSAIGAHCDDGRRRPAGDKPAPEPAGSPPLPVCHRVGTDPSRPCILAHPGPQTRQMTWKALGSSSAFDRFAFLRLRLVTRCLPALRGCIFRLQAREAGEQQALAGLMGCSLCAVPAWRPSRRRAGSRPAPGARAVPAFSCAR
jgi:hypothetical protein